VAVQQAMLSAKDGIPSIEILIGQAQHGTYRVYLWNEKGQDPTLLKAGTNWDQIRDRFDLGPGSALNQRMITWEVLISAVQPGAGQLYSVRVVIRQKNGPIQGGDFLDEGAFTGSKLVFGARQMIVI
jgi:hypothetical protein